MLEMCGRAKRASLGEVKGCNALVISEHDRLLYEWQLLLLCVIQDQQLVCECEWSEVVRRRWLSVVAELDAGHCLALEVRVFDL